MKNAPHEGKQGEFRPPLTEDESGRYRMLAELLPQLVWITRPDGSLEYVNQHWTGYTGLSFEESRENPWQRLLPPEDFMRAEAVWNRSLQSGSSYEVEYRVKGADGDYRWFLTRAVPLIGDDGQILRWLGSGADIHERKQAEEMQRFLTQVSDRTRTITNPEEMLWEVVSMVGDYLQVSRCAYGEIDWQADTITISRDYCRGVLSIAGTYPRSSFGRNVTEDLALGRTVVNRDTRLDPRSAEQYEAVYRKLGIRASVNVPIMKEGHQVATFAVQMADTPREWTANEISLMETIAERTWLTVENARLYRMTQQADALQRLFLRDVLTSVTEGRLTLCLAIDDLPPPLAPVGRKISLRRKEGVGDLRHAVLAAAKSLGFTEERSNDLLTATSEAAMNAVVHAHHGWGQIGSDGKDTIQVWIGDEGTGITMENLPRATLVRGYSTKNTLGHGFKLILETIDRLYLLTEPTGSTIVLEQDRTVPALSW